MITNLRLKISLLLLLWGVISATSVAESISSPVFLTTVDVLTTPVNLSRAVEFLEDTYRKFSREDVESAKFSDRWQQLDREVLIARNPAICYWFRLSLVTSVQVQFQKPVLYIPNHSNMLYELSFWHDSATQKSPQTITGSFYPYSQQALKANRYVIPLSVDMNTAQSTYKHYIIGRVDQRDTALPGLLPIVRLLREKGFEKPIFALTGNVSTSDVDQCAKASCSGHLAKPIDAEKLKATIELYKPSEMAPIQNAIYVEPGNYPPQ